MVLLNRETLRHDAKGKRKQTLLQTTSIVERRTTLLKRIQRFREIQQIYMPGFDPKNSAHLERLSSSNPSTTVHVEECKLYMPSDLSEADRRKYCPGDLAKMEDRLRFAEASDTLESLRHHLRTRSFTNRFKVANVTGQIHNTRARETQHRIDDKVKAAEMKYRRSRAALLRLRGPGAWEETLRVLEPSDVRALNEREMTAQEKEDIRRVRQRAGVVMDTDEVGTERVVATVAAVGEGLRRPSWIWFSGGGQEGVNDPLTRAGEFPLVYFWYDLLMGVAALRVEWAKAMARADRWEEDVVLLDEEMRRILVFCYWKAAWWMEQVPLREGVSGPLAEGLRAYAEEQADMERRIHSVWEVKWAGARSLAQPIIQAFWGEIPTEPTEQVVGPIELDIEDDREGNADDSDFEE
jgi:hypothetical protein